MAPATPTESRSEYRRQTVCLVGLFAACSLFPLDEPALWWNLAAGRASLAAGYRSFAELSADGRTPAHWLAGVPAFAAWNVAGSDGLMVLRLAIAMSAGCCMAWLVRNGDLLTAATAMLVAIATSDTWRPGPICWDALWTLVSVALLLSGQEIRTVRRWAFWAGVLVGWANTGRLPLLGVMLAAISVFSVNSRRTVKKRGSWAGNLAAFALLVGPVCLNPVGWIVLHDSAVYMAPVLLRPEVRWLPGSDVVWLVPGFRYADVPFALASFIAAAIAGMAVWRCLRSSRASGFPAAALGLWILGLLAGLLSPGQVGTASILAFGAAAVAARTIARAGHAGDAGTSPAASPLSSSPAPLDRSVFRVAVGIVCALWLWLAVGGPGGLRSRLGWGIAWELQLGSLPKVLTGLRAATQVAAGGVEGIPRHRPQASRAYCSDVSAAGALAWLCDPRRLQVHALITRTVLDRSALRAEVALRRDVAQGRMFSYRRTDGTWGGWWLEFRERQIECVGVSLRDPQVLAAFRDSVFQPASLDGSVVWLASVEDGRFRSAIVRNVQFLEHADRGGWRYAPPPATGAGGGRDIIGTLTGRWRTIVGCRQAEALWNLGRRTAALRVLHAVPPGFAQRRRQLARCIAGEALHEQLMAGRPSLFRVTALRELGSLPEPLWECVRSLPPPSETYVSAVRTYLRGELRAAAGAFSGNDAESAYARLRILFEAADLAAAAKEREAFLRRHGTHPLAVLVREWLP